MESPNWAISIYPKSHNAEWHQLKQVRLITLVLKYGMASLMIQNAIFGHLVA